MKPNTAFDLFQVSEDHEALREAVRAVAEDKIAPYAAEVDQTASFPEAAYDALVASDFHAPHVPEEYDGVGADALACAIVVEEVARVCASSSLIPGANKLGSTALILAGSEELKHRYLTPLAKGETTFSYALSEREAGSDTASMRTRATADGDGWVLNGQKSWITNAGVSEYYTVLAATDQYRHGAVIDTGRDRTAKQSHDLLGRGRARHVPVTTWMPEQGVAHRSTDEHRLMAGLLQHAQRIEHCLRYRSGHEHAGRFFGLKWRNRTGHGKTLRQCRALANRPAWCAPLRLRTTSWGAVRQASWG